MFEEIVSDLNSFELLASIAYLKHVLSKTEEGNRELFLIAQEFYEGDIESTINNLRMLKTIYENEFNKRNAN